MAGQQPTTLEVKHRCVHCEANAIFFCTQCTVHLCGSCREQSHVLPFLQQHDFLDIEDFAHWKAQKTLEIEQQKVLVEHAKQLQDALDDALRAKGGRDSVASLSTPLSRVHTGVSSQASTVGVLSFSAPREPSPRGISNNALIPTAPSARRAGDASRVLRVQSVIGGKRGSVSKFGIQGKSVGIMALPDEIDNEMSMLVDSSFQLDPKSHYFDPTQALLRAETAQIALAGSQLKMAGFDKTTVNPKQVPSSKQLAQMQLNPLTYLVQRIREVIPAVNSTEISDALSECNGDLVLALCKLIETFSKTPSTQNIAEKKPSENFVSPTSTSLSYLRYF